MLGIIKEALNILIFIIMSFLWFLKSVKEKIRQSNFLIYCFISFWNLNLFLNIFQPQSYFLCEKS